MHVNGSVSLWACLNVCSGGGRVCVCPCTCECVRCLGVQRVPMVRAGDHNFWAGHWHSSRGSGGAGGAGDRVEGHGWTPR